MNKTKIDWTDQVWNPITGCERISEGCQNCYAAAMAKRLQAMNIEKYENGFKVTVHPELFDEPLQLKRPNKIFVCSMSDLFHEDVPYDVIDTLFGVMKEASWHIFQVLTKRPERLLEYSKKRNIPDNVWVGTTVESKNVLERIKVLSQVKAQVHFLSCEPLLESLEGIKLAGIDWVIAGGETGVKARKAEEQWFIDLKNECYGNSVPFFFKSLGGRRTPISSLLDGNEYKEFPEVLGHHVLKKDRGVKA